MLKENVEIPKELYVEFRAANLASLDGGVPEEDLVLKQDDAGCNREMGIPEDDVE